MDGRGQDGRGRDAGGMAGLAAGADPAQPTDDSASRAEALDGVLAAAVTQGLVPGVAAAAATAGGVLYRGVRGADLAADSVFWVAAMTELATAVLALGLVEEGSLSLHRPLGALLPELEAPQVLEGFSRNGEPILRAAARPITLHHLLTHTAGIGIEFWDATLLRFGRAAGVPPVLERRLAGLRLPLVFDPGERWLYGMAGDWVGRAIEAATGLSLAEAMQARLLGPLGMTDTGFALDPGRAARLAPLHRRGPGGMCRAEPPYAADGEYHSGGSGLFSTVRDMLVLTRMLLGRGVLDGVRVLRAETVAAMGAHQIGGLRPAPLPAARPEMSCDVALPDAGDPGWGLAGLVDTAPSPHGRGVGTLSWGGVTNTFFWVDAVRGVSGVLLAPLLPFADHGALAASQAFEAAVYAALPRDEGRGRRSKEG